MSTRVRRLAMINSDGKARPPLPDPEGIVTTSYDLRLRVMARTPYDHLFTELGTLDAAESALRESCDAIYIDTFGDYASARIRSTTSVPVVGAGEASIAAAAERLGDYSIVTVWPRSMTYLYAERLGSCDGGEQCLGTHFLSAEDELDRVGRADGVKARMIRHEDDIVDRLAVLCHEAVAADGAHGVLLGCTCMSPIAEELQRRCGFPVLDPSRCGLAAAFAAVTAEPQDADGPLTAQGGLARDVVAAYLGDDTAPARSFDDCEVCAVGRPSAETGP